MFFYVSKIAWVFAQPSNLLLVLLCAGTALLFTTRRRLARPLLAAAVAGYVVLGLSPLSTMLLAGLENRFVRTDLTQGPQVQGIIILGGAEDGRAGTDRELAGLNEAAERLTEGAALALRFPSAQVVFSGGNAHLTKDQPAEAVSASAVLQALGVARERLVLEEAARNTWENAVFTKALIDPKPGERWLLVTSAFHMPRAMGCFRKAGLAVEPWPVDYRTAKRWKLDLGDNYITGLRQTDFVVREYIGLVAYALTGKTDALLPR